jgi:Rod binding domain-containing protein
LDSGYYAVCAGLRAQTQALEIVANARCDCHPASHQGRWSAASGPGSHLMHSVSVALRPASNASEEVKYVGRVLRAAQDFEALLLGALLDPIEHSFSSVPGEDDATGSDAYRDLGTEALASGLAASGGLGIAAMIARNLLKPEGVVAQGAGGPPAKVFPSHADTTR